jgi:type I restriction enzyme, S subunit
MNSRTFKTYLEYKESEVPWTGPVPTHWILTKFKHVLAEKKKAENQNLPAGSISFGNVIYKNSDNLSAETKHSYQEVLSGEFLVNPLNLNYDLKSLRTALSKIDVVVSTGYMVLVSKGNLAKNYIRWLLYQFDVAHMKTLGAGVRQTVNFSDIGNSFFYAPLNEEQIKIANFLDHETAKIDTLIEKQQQLIKLLKEKRQAVISHVVTKGLNLNAPTRDSGVEWLGEVPAHWGVTRLKYATSLIVDCPHETPIYDGDGEFKVIRTADISEGQLDSSEMYAVTRSEYLTRIRRQSLRKYDIVYGREGERWGFAAEVPIDDMYCLGQRMMQFRANKSMCSRYLMWQLNSLTTYRQGQMDTVGATSPHVNVETIRNYVLAEPPLDEQRTISRFLDAETIKLDKLKAEVERTITLLKERRTALISAAVTGKIDVRNWKSPSQTNNQKIAA